MRKQKSRGKVYTYHSLPGKGMKTLRVGMAQINPTVGDLKGNKKKIIGYITQAKEQGIDLLTFPELSLSGYPPQDLLFKPGFLKDNLENLREIALAARGITVVVGFADGAKDGNIYNAAALIHEGKVAAVYHKIHLSNYGVFDERRYFQAGREPTVFVLKEIIIDITICEDTWFPHGPVAMEARGSQADVILNISASPYYIGKRKLREKILSERARKNCVIISYNNLIGGQDELVFDGGGMIFNQKGEKVVQGRYFEEDLITADFDIDAVREARSKYKDRVREDISLLPKVKRIELTRAKEGKKKLPLPEKKVEKLTQLEEIYRALILGTRDYAWKNGFKKVVIGLSGGIDSSLTAVIAVDALERGNVTGLSMPSTYSSIETRADTRKLAQNLGIRLITIPIEEIFQTYLKAFQKEFKGLNPDVTEENLQARIRGSILMAISNKSGALLLTTGNKSEMSVGYCTLYGDMAGGFAVIKDVPKTLVYKLARYRNRKEGKNLIPESVFRREPSAELRLNQKDTDTLPPYSILDPILEAYVEEGKSGQEIVAQGFNGEIVKKVICMVDSSEYKRRQSPPGVKITPLALGRDRRFPITNRYRDF